MDSALISPPWANEVSASSISGYLSARKDSFAAAIACGCMPTISPAPSLKRQNTDGIGNIEDITTLFTFSGISTCVPDWSVITLVFAVSSSVATASVSADVSVCVSADVSVGFSVCVSFTSDVVSAWVSSDCAGAGVLLPLFPPQPVRAVIAIRPARSAVDTFFFIFFFFLSRYTVCGHFFCF